MVRKILLVTLLFSAYSFAQQDASSTVEQKQELSWEQRKRPVNRTFTKLV